MMMIGELITQLVNIALGIWRYRWRALAVSWIVAVLGWAWLYKQPDEYRATAEVYVDTDSVLRPLLKGMVVTTDISEKIKMVSKMLTSRPNLEKVVKETDLDLRVHNQKQYNRLLDELAHKIQIVAGRKSNLYTIAYRDPDPKTAKSVVQTLLNGFVENTLGANRQDTGVAQRFLDQQIKEYEARLVEAERRLKEFKQKHVGMMPQDGKDYYNRLQTAMYELEEYRNRLAEAKNRRDELLRQIRGETPTFGMFTPITAAQTSTSFDARIERLQERLDELLLEYTDKHPDVVATREALEDLKRQRDEEIAAMIDSGGGSILEKNPVYQKLKISLGEVNAEIAGLVAKVRQQKKRVDELKRLVDTIPDIEAELIQLNRDYDVIKEQYESLLVRREAARMSELADENSDDVKFKIVSPPYVPDEPEAPNRILISTAILIVALGAGIGFGFFMYQINMPYFDRKTLARDVGLPVIGGILYMPNKKEKLKNALLNSAFAMLFFMLLAGYVGVLYTIIKGINPLGTGPI